MFTAAHLTTVKEQKQPEQPSTDDWFRDTMEYYSAMKKGDVRPMEYYSAMKKGDVRPMEYYSAMKKGNV